MTNPATSLTAAANRSWLDRLPFADGRDFEDARRGFVGTWDEGPIRTQDGTVAWDHARWDFLEPEASPDSVHPSLWRQARLNRIHGLFQVAEGIYQVRGFDIANITFIEGETGLIVVDPLTTVESARTALALYFRHRPARTIHTVVYTHSHADHFGGVRGIVDEKDVKEGRVRIVAPTGFVEETVSENVLAGPAMGRRSLYQFGQQLPSGPLGTVDAGLGKAHTAGTISLIAPTQLISEATETHTFDGVEFVFQLTPETEAPAELHFWLPRWKALNTAENATHTLHNLLPLRGAKARDAKAWSEYLNVALERWGRQADIVFAQHHWPIWGNARVVEYLGRQRAEGKRFAINWHFTDLGRDHLLTLERSTVNHLPGLRREDADLSLKLSQDTLRAVLLKQTNFVIAVATGKVSLRGNPLTLKAFFELFDEIDPNFPIVTPRPA